MCKYLAQLTGMSFLICCLVLKNVWAESVLYDESLDGGTLTTGVANPMWGLSSNVPIAKGDLFEVVSEVAHSGNYSLRFNYNGRNGRCNLCGDTKVTQSSQYDDVSYFVDINSSDLTLSPFNASPGRVVMNNSNGWSKWEITSVSSKNAVNDQLNLIKLASSIDGSNGLFRSDDQILLARECGVDGIVGGQLDKRSDCNIAINNLTGLSQTPQAPGESIYRRVYLRIAKDSVLPDNQKLRYWHTTTGSIYLSVRVDKDTGLPYCYVGANPVEGPGFTRPPVNFETDTWYYFEEEFKAETSDLANDGEYRLWIAESGAVVDKPAVELTGLNMGVVERTSLWGNHQHNEDSSGYWYIDDFKIARMRIGPEGQQAAPNPPSLVQ